MDPKKVKINTTLELLNGDMTEEAMNTLYQVFRDAAKFRYSPKTWSTVAKALIEAYIITERAKSYE